MYELCSDRFQVYSEDIATETPVSNAPIAIRNDRRTKILLETKPRINSNGTLENNDSFATSTTDRFSRFLLPPRTTDSKSTRLAVHRAFSERTFFFPADPPASGLRRDRIALHGFLENLESLRESGSSALLSRNVIARIFRTWKRDA